MNERDRHTGTGEQQEPYEPQDSQHANDGLLKRKKPLLEHWQKISLFLLVFDVVAVNATHFLALWIRFDLNYTMIPPEMKSAFIRFMPINSVICVLVFWLNKLYNSIWRFASYSELVRTIRANVITAVLHTVGITLLFTRMPISYYIFGAGLQFMATLGIRFSYRLILLLRGRRGKQLQHEQPRKNVMIIGAGNAGQTILRDIVEARETNDQVLCFIDDNSNKWGRYIDGIPVVGGRDDILVTAKKYKIDKILLALPSATAEARRDILAICQETDCELKTLPGIYQLVSGEVSIEAMKSVSVEDLLGREPIRLGDQTAYGYLQGKTVLVTGGGGSIGSELCRQLAGQRLRQLIILDIYENNAYNIQLELRNQHPALNLVTLIGSVRDSRKLDQVFGQYKPDVVFHAAAHKHVPLMEDSPCEAIKNNAIGTYKTAYAAIAHGCERFVLISTDKAVNPTNIMGASKRLAEMILQSFAHMIREGRIQDVPTLFTHKQETDTRIKRIRAGAKTELVAVRFGNVLGSSGSVIPVFRKQILKGGPVTVTHPEIIRYFMTIPEAVSLVMEAGAYAKGGEIFVLDMGSPVKIDTLARNLIKLSGFKPDVDIKVEYTGLRPGEKLYEEKLMAEEGLMKTPNELIHVGLPVPFDEDGFLARMTGLMQASYSNEDAIRDYVSQIVPTYVPEGLGDNIPVELLSQ